MSGVPVPMSRYARMAIGLFLVAVLGDIITTAIGLSAGQSEFNPIMAALLSRYGLVVFHLVRAMMGLVAAAVMYWAVRRYARFGGWHPIAIAVLVTWATFISNLALIWRPL